MRFVAAQTIRAVFNPDFAWSWEWPFKAQGETARQAKSRMARI
jgi:hypothetical protein